jgi:hypothetical protein
MMKSRSRCGPPKGQSLVELALLMPLLMLLLSSLLEFGFALNEYLDLVDSARETARFLSNRDPYEGTGPGKADRTQFYLDGVEEFQRTVENAGWIKLDPNLDDLIISVFTLDGTRIVERRPVSFTDSRCSATNGGQLGWRLYCNKVSAFPEDDSIEKRISPLSPGSIPPDTGVVLVEVFYDYQMKMGLPWVTGIVGDTITLHAYTFMPNAAAEP